MSLVSFSGPITRHTLEWFRLDSVQAARGGIWMHWWLFLSLLSTSREVVLNPSSVAQVPSFGDPLQRPC